MSQEYPEWDEQSKQFYRWEWMGDQRVKAYQPDFIFCGTPEKAQPKPKPPTQKCPLRTHRPKCSMKCALYSGDGCEIAAEPANNNTAGKNCPFDSQVCNNSCGFFNSGCTLISYFERRTKE